MSKFQRVCAAAAAVGAFVVAGAAIAGASPGTTGDTAAPETTVPATDTSMADHHMSTAEPEPGTLVDDGSAEPASPEADAFCEAEVAAEAAFSTEDDAVIGPAVEALTAAAEPVGLAETVAARIAAGDPTTPEFAEANAAIIEYMKANCGYAQVEVVASEYQFQGVPTEIPAGPVILSLENAGEQVHELMVVRINDDVTLSPEELFALPQDEAMAMITPAAFTLALPGTVSSATADLTPGRYVALCFIPDGLTPDVMGALLELGVDGPEDTIPPDAGFELGPPHFTKGMLVEITVA